MGNYKYPEHGEEPNVVDLKRQNQKMREALEEIANPTSSLKDYDSREELISIAQQALNGVDD